MAQLENQPRRELSQEAKQLREALNNFQRLYGAYLVIATDKVLQDIQHSNRPDRKAAMNHVKEDFTQERGFCRQSIVHFLGTLNTFRSKAGETIYVEWDDRALDHPALPFLLEYLPALAATLPVAPHIEQRFLLVDNPANQARLERLRRFSDVTDNQIDKIRTNQRDPIIMETTNGQSVSDDFARVWDALQINPLTVSKRGLDLQSGHGRMWQPNRTLEKKQAIDTRFETLYQQHRPAIQSAIEPLVGNAQAAAEITNEAATLLYQFFIQSAISKIAANAFHRRWLNVATVLAKNAEPVSSTYEDVISPEDVITSEDTPADPALVAETLSMLTDQERLVLAGLLDGKTLRTIGSELQISHTAAFHIKKKIVQKIQEQGVPIAVVRTMLRPDDSE